MNNNPHLMQKYAQIFVQVHDCSKKWTIFQEQSLRKTVSLKKKIISTEENLSIF